MEEKSYVHYPIPLWVKAFAAGIGLIVLFALFTFPRNIALVMHLERGKAAIQARKYLTAQKEFTEVLKKTPDNLEAQGYQVIAAFYNQDEEVMLKGLMLLVDKKTDDDEMYKGLDEIKFTSYFPTDSFRNFRTNHEGISHIADTAWRQYFLQNPDDLYSRIVYSDSLMDEKDYPYCDTIVEGIIKEDPSYLPGLMMMASLKREQGEWDASLDYCNKMLMINSESVYALASKARTLLRQKKDREALELALSTYQMDQKNSYGVASLLLAYHFNGKTKDRDELIRKASPGPSDSVRDQQLQYALDVIAKKEQFRD